MDENFLNYFASKMIWLNLLQNVALYLLKYFILHITLIPRNDTFLYYWTNQICFCCIILRNAFLAPEQIK